MKVFKKLIDFFIIFIIFLISVVLIYFHRRIIDNNQSNLHIFIFIFWFINLLIFLFVILLKIFKQHKLNKIINFIKEDFLYLLTVLFFSLFTRIVFLISYPYIALGDEIRDAGLYALMIKEGKIKDFFDFGAYQAHGLLIPLFSYLFNFLFKNFILFYRFLSSAVSVLTILFVYLIGRIAFNKKIALVSSLFLTFSYIFFHYSRTELVNVFDSLIVVFIFLSIFLIEKSIFGYMVLGSFLGLSFNFYSGLKGIVAAGLIFMAFQILKILIKSDNKKQVLKNLLIIVILFIFGFIIGVGPKLNHLYLKNKFFKSGTVSEIIFENKDFQEKKFFEKIETIYSNYLEAFLYYLSKNKSEDFHFKYKTGLLNFPLGIFFLVGLFNIINNLKDRKDKNYFLIQEFIILAIFIYPFTNQVIPNQIGLGHRLLGIIPAINLVAGYGFYTFFSLIKNKLIKKTVLIISLIIILNFYFYNYFFNRLSDYYYQEKDYLFQYALEYLKNEDKNFHFYLHSQPNLDYDYKLLHYQEKADYFLYPKKVAIINDEEIKEVLKKKEKKIIVSFKKVDEKINIKPIKISYLCENKNKRPGDYRCPYDFNGLLTFFVYKFYK